MSCGTGPGETVVIRRDVVSELLRDSSVEGDKDKGHVCTENDDTEGTLGDPQTAVEGRP